MLPLTPAVFTPYSSFTRRGVVLECNLNNFTTGFSLRPFQKVDLGTETLTSLHHLPQIIVIDQHRRRDLSLSDLYDFLAVFAKSLQQVGSRLPNHGGSL